jgi:hypothetical protein
MRKYQHQLLRSGYEKNIPKPVQGGKKYLVASNLNAILLNGAKLLELILQLSLSGI